MSITTTISKDIILMVSSFGSFINQMLPNGGGMASKGFRMIPYQVTRKAEAGYNPSHTTDTLIGYTACYGTFLFNSNPY